MNDIFWRIAHCLYQKGINHIARLFELASMTLSSHAISARIVVGQGTKFWHHGLGCVVLRTTVIGDNCNIFQNVTIGKSFSYHDNPSPNRGGYCSIGNNVMIGAGAVILGNVTIGDNVQIGANAVVIHDVPDDCLAVGVPARIISKA